MSDSELSAYAPILIAALEHERACYATLLQLETDQARNADTRLADEFAGWVREARTRWTAVAALVAHLQRVLQLEETAEGTSTG